jgi:hypothetical protein
MHLLSLVSSLFTKSGRDVSAADRSRLRADAESDRALSLMLATRKVTAEDRAGYDRVAWRVLSSLEEQRAPHARTVGVDAECERLKALILSTRKVTAEDRERQRSVARRILASLGQEPV